MSQHRSLRGSGKITTKRNVLKRFERVDLLQKRGQTSEDESLYASVQRHYGNRVAEELWRLVDVCPFIPEKDSSKEK